MLSIKSSFRIPLAISLASVRSSVNSTFISALSVAPKTCREDRRYSSLHITFSPSLCRMVTGKRKQQKCFVSPLVHHGSTRAMTSSKAHFKALRGERLIHSLRFAHISHHSLSMIPHTLGGLRVLMCHMVSLRAAPKLRSEATQSMDNICLIIAMGSSAGWRTKLHRLSTKPMLVVGTCDEHSESKKVILESIPLFFASFTTPPLSSTKERSFSFRITSDPPAVDKQSSHMEEMRDTTSAVSR
mmetsp:Transcript_295/g.738  ORF Transcript_295/g.738 Transcript_295/m.738 type:complete len:243 (+) Transcript_295:528-1256(+)